VSASVGRRLRRLIVASTTTPPLDRSAPRTHTPSYLSTSLLARQRRPYPPCLLPGRIGIQSLDRVLRSPRCRTLSPGTAPDLA
jgi:hypothetical protein